MNVISQRPDISVEAIAKRRKAVNSALAANQRQGYVFDKVLESLSEQFVQGVITYDEYNTLVQEQASQSLK